MFRMQSIPRLQRFVICACCAAGVASATDARGDEEHGHLDFSPTLEDGSIVSNGWNDDEAEFVPGERVFGLEFGEVPGSPYFATDPGFNVQDGSGFAPGSQVGFRLLDTLGYWDGTGAVAFSAPASGESMEFYSGPVSRSLDGTSFDGSDAFVGPVVDSEGGTHFHLNTEIFGSDGDDDPAPAAGVYLIQMALLNSAVTGASDPVFVLFNNGLNEQLHGESIEWVEANLVPEPTAAALLAGLGGLALMRRRHRA